MGAPHVEPIVAWTRRRFASALAGCATAGCAIEGPPEPPPQTPARTRASTAMRPPPPPPPWQVALGDLDDLAPAQRRWLLDARDHEPATERALSIMHRHDERSLTVAEHLVAQPNRVDPQRRTLVLHPIGSFPFDVVEAHDFVGLVRSPPLGDLAAVISALFGLPVEVAEPEAFVAGDRASRIRDGLVQYDAIALLGELRAKLPPHAYGMLGLVNIDLFALAEQQYAFGWSLHRGRRGIASFARLDPSFVGGRRPDDLPRAILHRSVRLVAHECAHLFGLTHCAYFRCLLGPVDHLGDLDALAPRPCPVCQCKLLRTAGVDPIAAAAATDEIYARLGIA